MPNAEEAVTALEELGLTEYEARCFAALTRLSKGTAKEVSQVADIPRSRVYDTIERLERRGLVSVQQTEPREYKAVPIETACRRIREDFDSRINAAENALGQLEKPDSADDEGMWAITQPEHVTERIVTFLEEAEESIHYLVAATEVVDPEIQTALGSAVDRGVNTYIEVSSEAGAEKFTAAVPNANTTIAADLETTNDVCSELPAQLLLVDKRAIVSAGMKESDLPDVVNEMAVWTYGRDHGFAVWIRELLDNRLPDQVRES
ncbi:TrmB family transcriptional regulator [Natrinema halophilum]|uniref:TrmB family transcriptional regulator n=1 Tax=Natrinema halophilum TaxID=1699371 RepID=A0A7D5GI51_9EURY|nr:TrmB family transcriptional regulator [Natrinema halophilum]QLG49674.1 TrmB family transcriptional regulator [Natrinema halophilum]